MGEHNWNNGVLVDEGVSKLVNKAVGVDVEVAEGASKLGGKKGLLVGEGGTIVHGDE